jgi:hypothetical protein
LALLILVIWQNLAVAQNDTARNLFADYKSAILQIRIIDLTSGSKSAIGSGFPVAHNGLIATNYHVIQLAASEPDQYRIEYLTEDNQTGVLSLVDVDVINDLALVKSESLVAEPLELAADEPQIGTPVYALGNPLDLGLTVVPGTYNGIDTSSYYQRVHFTGSLNPGMSGGPTLDPQGRIAGINVSTAGNQISFLVPASRLHRLMAEYQTRGAAVEDINQRIADQLMEDQQQKLSQMLALPWSTMPLGEADVLQELSPYVKCWGGSNSSDNKAQYLRADRSCSSEDNIYLNSGFNTGAVEYQFFWLEADKLNSLQFYNFYQNLYADFMPGNRGGEEDVTQFECDNGFVASDTGRKSKVVICLRAYNDYPELYDMLFLQGTVDHSDKAFLSHFTLAGVSKPNSLAFARKFMEVSQWQ